MIPERVKKLIMPALAARGEAVPRVPLPCGLDLKFIIGEETVGWAEFGTWGISTKSAGEAAGLNAISYIQWAEVEAGVFENEDGCWPEMVLAPSTFVEHNGVPGRPVVYVKDARTAILTGSECAAGLTRIREAMRGGLAACPMALNGDRKTWSRFYVHDATAIDLHRVTVAGHATGEGRYVRQASPPSHYGHVILEVAPHVGAHDYLLVWAVDEKVIPAEYRTAVWEGIQGFATEYFREAGPLVGVRVTITGGSYHEVDSRAASYRIAAGIAFKNAVMQMEVTPLPERRQEQSSAESDEGRGA